MEGFQIGGDCPTRFVVDLHEDALSISITVIVVVIAVIVIIPSITRNKK